MFQLYPERTGDTFHLPEAWRLEVFERLFDGLVDLRRFDFTLGDFAPRNVMLVPQGPSLTSGPPRIVYRAPRLCQVNWVNHLAKDVPC